MSPRHLVILLAAGALLGAGWWLWPRERAPGPPDVPLEGAEPRVVQVIESEMDRVRRQPRSGAAWGRLGQVLRAHGFDEQATACWAHAERFDKQEPRWPYYRGVVLLMLGDRAGLDCLRRAVALADNSDPGNLGPRLTLAEQLLARAETNEAVEVLRVVEHKAPNSPHLRFCQAAVAERGGDLRRAIQLFERLARHPCARQKASARLAALYGRLGQPEKAAGYGELAARLPPDARWPDSYWAALTNLEVGRQGRFRELKHHQAEKNDAAAVAQLVDMVKGEDADYEKAHLALGLTLLRLGERDQAEGPLRKALALEPKSVRALYNLAAVRFLQAEEQREAGRGNTRQTAARYEEAIGLLRRAIELKPTDAYAHLVLGRALLAQGRRKEAIEALRVPPVTRPEDFRSHLFLAEALIEDGQLAEARIHLGRAGQLAAKDNPDVARARQRLSEKEKKAGPSGVDIGARRKSPELC